MAKRTRGSTRPGQRRPARRDAARPEAPRPEATVRAPQGLTEQEEARAAEIEARIVAEERAAEQARSRGRERVRGPEVERVARGQSLIEARSAEEYGYVVRDVRRILQVGGSLVGVMLILYVLIEVAHVVSVG